MAVYTLLLQKEMPELLAPAFLYKKKLKRNAGIISSGDFYIKKLKRNAGAISSGDFYIKKSKKMPELLAPAK
jgi:hypothetical protein